MRQDIVNEVGGSVGVLLRTRPEAGFRQRTIDKTVLRVHDGRLRVIARFLLHTYGGTVAGSRQVLEVLHTLFASHVLAQIVQHLTVVLQQLDTQVAGGVMAGDMLVGLQKLLYLTDAAFYLVTVVDVQVAEVLAGSLVHLDDRTEQLLHAHAALERRGHHRHAKEAAQPVKVYAVTTSFELIVHVQRTHHP